MTQPSGARLPRGKVTVLVRPRAFALIRRHDDRVGIDLVAFLQQCAKPGTAFGLRPPVQDRTQFLARDRQRIEFEQAELAEVEHHLRHAAGEEDADRGVPDRAVGQRVNESRHAAIEEGPVIDGWPLDAGVEGDRGCVQQQVRAAAEGREHRQGVLECGFRQDVRCLDPAAGHLRQSAEPTDGPCRARSAGRTGRAPSAAARGRAPRRSLAKWPRCRGTGSRRRATHRRGSRLRRPVRA